MTSALSKLIVLLWKCMVLRKRNWLLTIFELVSPILVVLLLYFTRRAADQAGLKATAQDNNVDFEHGRTHSSSDNMFYSYLTNIYNSPVSNNEPTYIAYAPNTTLTDELMRTYKASVEISDPKWKLCMEAKRNEADLIKALREYSLQNSSYSCVLGVLFSEPTKTFKYKIITNFDDVFEQNKNPYTSSMPFQLQVSLDAQYLKSLGVNYEDTNALIGGFSQREVPMSDEFANKQVLSSVYLVMLYVFLTLAYTFLVTAVVRDTIQEKSSGIKELMRIMGVASWMIWVHWFIYSMFVQIPVTIAITVLLSLLPPKVFVANAFIVWLLFLLVTIDYIVIFFAVTCLFDRATVGTILCVFSWIVVNLALIAVLFPRDHSFPVQILISLVPMINLCWALQSLDSFSWKNVDWNLSDLFTEGYSGSQISVGEAIIIFVCQIILFTLLLAYLDAVKPGRYGVAKPVTFIFSCCVKLIQKIKQSSDSEEPSLPLSFEHPPPGSKVGIRIRGLHKEFGVFKKAVAVDCVNLDIYEREVTVLLGHNGAGKTTTMSMITGMFSPTSGTVSVDDKNIYENLYEFRQNLGLCTQHNLYFPKLTVIEHLMFFGMLKGRSRSQAREEGKYLLYMLNLIDKTDSKGSKLSGGMLRRLCLAVALTGGPKVLILDEPTSGLDPENRRHIWDIILSLRGERTILITTHYMEEADVLGDRIAIMDHGKVVCCGTTMFLKKLYGTGYNIHVTKNARSSSIDITQSVQRYIPQFKTKVVSPTQVDYTIKDEFVERFPDMFSTLESSMSSLGVTAITVSCTTMEDVFLRVAEMSEQQDQDHGEPKAVNVQQNDYNKVEGIALIFQRVEALLTKHLIYTYKHLITTIIKLVVACLLILCAVLLTDKYRFKENWNTSYAELVKTNLTHNPDSIYPVIYDDSNTKTAKIVKNIIKSTNGQAFMLKLENYSQYKNVDAINQPMNKLLTTMKNSVNASDRVVLASTFIENNFLIQYQPVLVPFASSNAANLMANVLLKRAYPDRSIESETHSISHKLTSRRSPCYQRHYNLYYFYTVFFLVAIIPCALTLIIADLIPLTVEERITGFKYQQIIAGISPLMYRICSFLYDFCLYLTFFTISLVIILIFGSNVMPLSLESTKMLLLVLILFGVSSIIFLFAFTSINNSPAASTALYVVLNLAFTLVCPILLVILHSNKLLIQLLVTMILSLHPSAACFFALYNIAHGIANYSVCPLFGEIESFLGFPTASDRNSILIYVLFLIVDIVLYSAIILLMDSKICARMGYKRSGIYDCQSGDNDVMFETQRVRMFKEAGVDTTPLRVEGLVKKYRALRAANQVSFLVTRGECFGLLGVNGAGKTTTFKMLTGEIKPSSGNAFSTKYSVVSQTQQYLSNIGYCPQSDAILDDFTGRNTLTIVAKIRGVPRGQVRHQVDYWMSALGIEEHADKRTKTYSGGTKRKLGTAMAFIGEPIVALLDEPTTGVDPAARRKVWSSVKDRQSSGYSAVLSSHSMEECEALCSRLTIMRLGELCCIGTVQDLKTKFGQGYVVLLKFADTQDYQAQLAALKKDFLRSFTKSVVQDETLNMITYRVLDGRAPLSTLFSEVLRLKRKYTIIEDFIVSNATLEQLFLAIARGQDIRSSHP